MNQENMSIKEAKLMLRKNLDEGAKCPCCEQFVKMYRWQLDSSSAELLIKFYKRRGNWVHPLKELKVNNGQYAKMRFFGLIEPASVVTNPKEKPKVGSWRITQKGINFVLNQITVHQKVKLYDNKAYGFEGNQVSIKSILSRHLSYADLISEV